MHNLDYDHPDWDCRPNQVTYATAIDSWARRGRVDRVEALLSEMHQEYADNGNQNLKPNLLAFNGYLVALAKTGEVDKLQLQQRAYLAEQKKAAKAAKKKK